MNRLAGVQLETGEFVARQAIFVRPVIAPTLTACSPRSAATSTRPASPSSTALDARAFRASGVPAMPSTLRAQVITAAGAGSAAAIDINNDLVLDDITLAVASESSHQPSLCDHEWWT